MSKATIKRNPDTPPADVRIGGFEIRERIGAGGMAIVWKAHQTSLDRIVAIKVLRDEFASDPDEVRMFMDEARAAAKLSHPNIVQVYDTGYENGVYYFVMEYVSGQTLGRILRIQGKQSLKQALHVTSNVAVALDYAWRKAGIVHRDIKPDNIMLDDDGVVKVADLGLAKVGHGHSTNPGATVTIEGTPNYMAPEQAQGLAVDCRTDIYALGATLYHMVTGRMPFENYSVEDAMQAQIEQTLPNPRDINPHVSVGVVQIVTRMMMKRPDDRPADWGDAMRDIRRVAAGRVLLNAGVQGKSTVAPSAARESRSAASSVEPPKPSAVPASWRAVRWLVLLLIWGGLAVWLLTPLLRQL